jgi:hypothetical protein
MSFNAKQPSDERLSSIGPSPYILCRFLLLHRRGPGAVAFSRTTPLPALFFCLYCRYTRLDIEQTVARGSSSIMRDLKHAYTGTLWQWGGLMGNCF